MRKAQYASLGVSADVAEDNDSSQDEAEDEQNDKEQTADGVRCEGCNERGHSLFVSVRIVAPATKTMIIKCIATKYRNVCDV